MIDVLEYWMRRGREINALRKLAAVEYSGRGSGADQAAKIQTAKVLLRAALDCDVERERQRVELVKAGREEAQRFYDLAKQCAGHVRDELIVEGDRPKRPSRSTSR